MGPEQSARARPEFPFDAGVIGGEPRVPQHDGCDHRKTRDHDFARGAVIGAKAQQGCKRNGHIKSIALLEAKRARRIAKNILEKEDSADRQRADNRHDRRCGEWRVAAKQGHITVHRIRTSLSMDQVVPVVGVEPTLLLGTRF